MNTNPVLVAFEILVKLMGEEHSTIMTLVPGQCYENEEGRFEIINKTNRKTHIMVVFENERNPHDELEVA